MAIVEPVVAFQLLQPRTLRLPRAARVVFALIIREMATTQGRSSLGYLWAILQPVGGIVLLTVAFSIVMRAPPIGDNFPLFYASGVLPFTTYGALVRAGMLAIASNRRLLFYPEVSYMDAIVARAILAMLTQAFVTIIVFSAIIWLYDLRVRADLGICAAAMATAGFLGLGIGTLNSVIVYLVPSWQGIWSVITRPLFLASCIFYTFESMPLWVQDILWYNPLVHVVGMMRDGVYVIYDANYVSIGYALAVSGTCMLAGLVLLRRFAKDILTN